MTLTRVQRICFVVRWSVVIAILSASPLLILLVGCKSETTSDYWRTRLPYNSTNIKEIGNEHCVFRWEKQWFIASQQAHGYISLVKIDDYVPEKWLGEGK